MQFWGPLYKKYANKLENVEQTSTKVLRGLEHLLFEESLRDKGLFSLEKRQLTKYLKPACPYLSRGYQKDGARLITEVQLDTRNKIIKYKAI